MQFMGGVNKVADYSDYLLIKNDDKRDKITIIEHYFLASYSMYKGA